jgi:hypothetical protein
VQRLSYLTGEKVQEDMRKAIYIKILIVRLSVGGDADGEKRVEFPFSLKSALLMGWLNNCDILGKRTRDKLMVSRVSQSVVSMVFYVRTGTSCTQVSILPPA